MNRSRHHRFDLDFWLINCCQCGSHDTNWVPFGENYPCWKNLLRGRHKQISINKSCYYLLINNMFSRLHNKPWQHQYNRETNVQLLDQLWSRSNKGESNQVLLYNHQVYDNIQIHYSSIFKYKTTPFVGLYCLHHCNRTQRGPGWVQNC